METPPFGRRQFQGTTLEDVLVPAKIYTLKLKTKFLWNKTLKESVFI
jgi:hypothetical protein